MKTFSIEEAEKEFSKYTDNYNNENPLIKLKIDHTYRVACMSKYIAEQIGMDQENVELAWLIGLLHDIGRFEQLKRYNTFHDSKSLDHAMFGSELLFNEGLIRNYIEDDKYDIVIKKAIENHNKYSIEEGLNEQELLHSRIIRDADKLDIYYTVLDTGVKTFYNSNDVDDSKMTEKIYTDFMNYKSISNKETKTYLDRCLLTMALIFDLNFDCSYKVMLEKDYINQFIDTIDCKNGNYEKLEEVRNCANGYILRKSKNL